jgi:hypothetical protein
MKNEYLNRITENSLYISRINQEIERIKGTKIETNDNQTPDTVKGIIHDNIYLLKEKKDKSIEDAMTKLQNIPLLGITDSNKASFSDSVKVAFNESYGKTQSINSLDDSIFENLIREVPRYKELKEQENTISYEKDVKKNEVASVEGNLGSTIDPEELKTQTDMLTDGKEKIHDAIASVKEMVDKIHISKFKNAWIKDLKELREGSASIENLLQKLIDLTTKEMEKIKTRFESVHEISEEQQLSESANGNGEQYNQGERREGLMGGQPKEDINDPQVVYKILTDKVTKLKDIIDQLISFAQRNSNSVALLATNGEPSMFVQLYNKYIEDRADPKISKLEASEGLTESVNANQLSPRDILKPTIVDKTVFVAVTLIIRLFAVSLTNFLIDKKRVKTVEVALGVYLGIYIAIFILFVLVVNLDIYRMRIVFNYINVHGGYSAVTGHIMVALLFSALIFIILRNIRIIGNPNNTKIIEARTAEERANLRKRISVISMIIFIFTTIIVYVS